MSKTPNLRDRVSQLSIGAFLVTVIIMTTSFTIYSMRKSKILEKEIGQQLTLNIKNQIEMIIPSFLLPEQRAGMDLLLERIKADEGLEGIHVVESIEDLEYDLSGCGPQDDNITICSAPSLNSTVAISELSEAGVTYGHFVKAKKNSSSSSLQELMQLMGLILFILSIVFICFYLFATRILSKTLPVSLDQIVKWIEADIEGNRPADFNLPFKELEDLKLKISEVLDRHNRSRDQAIIGQLTSGIMHDIRTPLQSIVSAMHLVAEQEMDSPKRSSRLENLYQMCAHNLPIIGEIIETTLDGNRQIGLDPKITCLNETIERSIQLAQNYSEKRFKSIEFRSSGQVVVQHDPMQMMRVFNNLIKNALDASTEAGKEKTGARITVTSSDSRFVEITIEDSGKGINVPEDKLFRAFRTSKVRGTGLGLLITKKIVEAHNGLIKVSNESSLGGAKLTVLLPKFTSEGALL